ncbi:hypothetical protein LCGC14_1856760 [marine sediment metagenome]|uniref:Uncharacterized protein n=1 Tax=marine sediment metagenome TaxID=412755 RepID=A0A0F9G936_9ZZZZ
MNEKALEAAAETLRGALGWYDSRLERARACIEAYHAALPDDGLVKVLREEATIADDQLRGGMAVLLGKAADALEAARAAAPETSDDR